MSRAMTSSTRRRLAGAAAALGLLVLVAGVPLALFAVELGPIQIAAHPIWTNLLSPDDGTLLWVAVGALAWIAWAVLASLVILEVVAQLRGVHAPHIRGLALPQHAARTMVGWASLLFVTAPATGALVVTPAHATDISALPAVLTTAPVRSDSVVVPQPAMAPASPAAQVPMPAERAVREPIPGTTRYQVTRGDSLWRIADKLLGDPLRYTEIAELNKDVLGKDPDFIAPPMVLLIPDDNRTTEPDDKTENIYAVQPGDTLSKIARDELGDAGRYPEIFEASARTIQPGGARLTDPDLIRPEWELTIPDGDLTQETRRKSPTSNAGEPEHADDPLPTDKTGELLDPAQPGTPEPAPGAAPAATAPPTPAPATKAPAPTSTADATDRSNDESAPAWLLPGLTGAGIVLAGAVFLTVRAHRRSQLRFRIPGHLIAPVPSELAGVDRTVRTNGSAVAPRIEALDRLLRHLASTLGAPEQYPPLFAIELNTTTATLHLSTDETLPSPWAGSGSVWRAPLEVEPPEADVLAPYPLLVSIGATDDGTAWLLNLEHLGVTTIAGEPENVSAFGRHVAAELALSPWSTLVQVHAIGLGDDLADLDRMRLTCYPSGDTSPINLVSDADASPAGHDGDEAHVVIVAPAAAPPERVHELATAIAKHHGQRDAVLIAAASDLPVGTVLGIDQYRLHVPSLGIDLRAPGLTRSEAASVTALVRATETRDNVRMPVDDTITDGPSALVDAAGALRSELVTTRPDVDKPAGPSSLLPQPATSYADAAATTVEDVAQLAPPIPAMTRDAVLAADPTLDDDLAMWHSGRDCPVPRVALLGPMQVTAHGIDQEVSERKGHYIELLTYLWAHPHGVRAADLADEFGIKQERARVDISHLRKYLGTDPRTGQPHLPGAPGTRQRSDGTWTGYTLNGVLFDVDLFRRLRARAQARGENGIDDLIAALDLVRGEPFTGMRPDSWSWMLEGERHDQEFAAAVVDVAHLVVVRAVADGDLAAAHRAVGAAASVSPYDEIVRLDRAHVADLGGDRADAARLRGEVATGSDDYRPPLDTSSRTTGLLGKANVRRRNSGAG